MTTSTKLSGAALAPRPPSKGSFPLDHLSECKQFAIAYERCLKENDKQTSKCRTKARDYLECRMERGLMAKEEWSKLGLGKLENERGEVGAGNGDADVANGSGAREDGGMEKDRRKQEGSVFEKADGLESK